MLFNIIANTSFNIQPQPFLAWSPGQVLGNLAGLITVITLTWLLRTVPLNVAFPITTGLAVIGVQVFSARMLFHESISPAQWLGTLFIVVGIALISGR
jgi:multidrug transporter EmrE-like cation transporter